MCICQQDVKHYVLLANDDDDDEDDDEDVDEDVDDVVVDYDKLVLCGWNKPWAFVFLPLLGIQCIIRYIYMYLFICIIYIYWGIFIYLRLRQNEIIRYFKRYLLFACTDTCCLSKVLVNRLNIMVIFSIIIYNDKRCLLSFLLSGRVLPLGNYQLEYLLQSCKMLMPNNLNLSIKLCKTLWISDSLTFPTATDILYTIYVCK